VKALKIRIVPKRTKENLWRTLYVLLFLITCKLHIRSSFSIKPNIMNYNEDPKTINLYPESAFEEDLTPDLLGADIREKCVAIEKACKGKIR